MMQSSGCALMRGRGGGGTEHGTKRLSLSGALVTVVAKAATDSVGNIVCLAMTSACRHVAVTGPPGVGKTTLIQKVVSHLQEADVPCDGFFTKEVRQGGKRIGFDVVTLSGHTGVLSRQRPEGSSGRQEPRVGNYAVDVPSFESLALPLLQTQRTSPSILVLDEIGKMEMFSTGFVRGVRQAISDPSSTIIATIPIAKGRPIPLVEEIRSSPKFMVVNLTRAIRDDPAVLKKIISMLRTSLKK